MENEVVGFREIREIAEAIKLSQLVPIQYKNRPQDLIAIALRGKGLGLDIWEAMTSIHMIQGKPCLSANLMMGLAMRRCPEAEFKYEQGTDFCRLKARRSSAEEWSTFEFTMDDAKTAGLAGKENWQKYPKQMLRSRVQSECARALFADTLIGVYTPEEINPDVRLDAKGEVIVDAKAEVIENDSWEAKLSKAVSSMAKIINEDEADSMVSELAAINGEEGAWNLIKDSLSEMIKQAKKDGWGTTETGEAIRAWFKEQLRNE